jgi:hypothetical protein
VLPLEEAQVLEALGNATLALAEAAERLVSAGYGDAALAMVGIASMTGRLAKRTAEELNQWQGSSG